MSIPSLATVGSVMPNAAFPGMVLESWPPNGIVSGINESATALDFGQVCVLGTAVAIGKTPNIKPQAADGDKIFGVVCRAGAGLVASTDGQNTVNFQRYSCPDVMKKGVIAVMPCEDVTAGDNALVITAGSGSKIGGTTGGAAGAGRIAFPGPAQWLTTTTVASGVPGRLSLLLP